MFTCRHEGGLKCHTIFGGTGLAPPEAGGRALRILTTSLLLVLVGGCVTPVIPLPPPDPTRLSITVDAAKGEVVLVGKTDSPLADVLIYLFNVETGKGNITRASADGSFITDPLPVADGGMLELWAARDGDDSPSSVRCLVVSYTGTFTLCQ